MAKTTTTDILQTRLTIDGKEYNLELKKAGGNLGKFEKKSEESFAGIKKSYLKMAAAIAAGGFAAKKVFDFARAGAQIRDLEFAFRKMGGSAQSMMELQSAVAGTMDEATLMRMSNMGQTLGINADQFTELSKVGKAAAKVLGIDVRFAMDSVITGTARQSKLWLDNLGIIIDIEAAQKKYAASIGKTTKALTEAEKKQSFINATIEQGQKLIGVAGEGAAVDGYDQLSTALVDLKNSYLQVLSPMGSFSAFLAKQINLFNTPLTDGSMGALLFQGVGIPQATLDSFKNLRDAGDSFLGDAAAAERAAAIQSERSAGAAVVRTGIKKGGEVNPLAAFLAAQELETAALIEQQQARNDKIQAMRAIGAETLIATEQQALIARGELDAKNREEQIAFIAEGMAIEQEMQLDHSNALIAIQQNEYNARVALEAQKRGIIADGLTVAAKAFGLSKELAIGRAIISTYQGAAQALASVAYPYNLIAAATVIASGLAQVNKIKSVNAKGGGGGGGGGHGGGRGGAAFGGAAFGGGGGQPTQGESVKPTVTIVLQGGMEALLDEVNSFVEDNDFELIATRSLR